MAFASSRRARTSSLAASATSPGMMRPGGRAGSASSFTTESTVASALSPRSAAFTSLISFFLAPMIPFSVGYRGSLSPFCAASAAGSGRSKISRPPSIWRPTRMVLPASSTDSSMIQDALGPERDGHHVALPALLLDPERLLESIFIVRGDDPGDAGRVDGRRVGPDLHLRRRVGHLLDHDEDLHAVALLS